MACKPFQKKDTIHRFDAGMVSFFFPPAAYKYRPQATMLRIVACGRLSLLAICFICTGASPHQIAHQQANGSRQAQNTTHRHSK